jgi:hypothetical protein
MHYRPPWLKTGEVLVLAGDTGEIAFMWFGHAAAPYSALRPDNDSGECTEQRATVAATNHANP